MKLSILVCTLKARHVMFAKLAADIQSQIKDKKEVELLYFSDRGGLSVGWKRQELLKQASGDYICYVDDDDKVSDFYVRDILEAIKPRPDCVGLEGVLCRKGQKDATFIHSLQCTRWRETKGVFYRTPNHLNPVKKGIALQAGFKDLRYGEDRLYSEVIYPLLKKEVMVTSPLYYYYPGASQ